MKKDEAPEDATVSAKVLVEPPVVVKARPEPAVVLDPEAKRIAAIEARRRAEELRAAETAEKRQREESAVETAPVVTPGEQLLGDGKGGRKREKREAEPGEVEEDKPKKKKPLKGQRKQRGEEPWKCSSTRVTRSGSRGCNRPDRSSKRPTSMCFRSLSERSCAK